MPNVTAASPAQQCSAETGRYGVRYIAELSRAESQLPSVTPPSPARLHIAVPSRAVLSIISAEPSCAWHCRPEPCCAQRSFVAPSCARQSRAERCISERSQAVRGLAMLRRAGPGRASYCRAEHRVMIRAGPSVMSLRGALPSRAVPSATSPCRAVLGPLPAVAPLVAPHGAPLRRTSAPAAASHRPAQLRRCPLAPLRFLPRPGSARCRCRGCPRVPLLRPFGALCPERSGYRRSVPCCRRSRLRRSSEPRPGRASLRRARPTAPSGSGALLLSRRAPQRRAEAVRNGSVRVSARAEFVRG